jgi:CheY-like chemotaxis protein
VPFITRYLLDAASQKQEEKHVEQFKQHAHLKVLVVDDMKINQMLLVKILQKYGCEVIDSAANGKEAVDKCQQNTYDIVFMDCQMPEVDGFEATRQIRKEEETLSKHHLHIVALTADAMVGDREKCLNAGMDDYLNKPIKAADILTMLEKVA